MKKTYKKKIIIFKIKNFCSNFYKILFLDNNSKRNIIFFVFGLYFKNFFDVGLNIFGTIPYWFNRIVGFVNLREFAFFKVLSLNSKLTKLIKNYNFFFNNLLKRSKQGFYLEFKVVGYFRAKRISLLKKTKGKKNELQKFIIMYFGYSHIIFISSKSNVTFVRGKKRFMFFTSNKQEFEKIIRQVFHYKPFNVYKIKGIRTMLNLKKMKPGKQKQQKKVIKK